MYVCTIITYGKGKDQLGEVASPARGQLNRKNVFSLSPFARVNLVSWDSIGGVIYVFLSINQKRLYVRNNTVVQTSCKAETLYLPVRNNTVVQTSTRGIPTRSIHTKMSPSSKDGPSK